MNASPFSTAARAVTLVVIPACFVIIVLDRSRVFGDNLTAITSLLYNWAILLGAFALLLGAGNVAWVHLRHVQQGDHGWSHSLALLVTLFAVMVAGLLDAAGTASPLMEWLFTNLIAPGQAALFAILLFFMAAAAFRYLRIGRAGGTWLLAGALLMMISQLPAAADALPPPLFLATVWLLEGPAMAALRGVLLGASLAAVLMGMRIILGRS